MNEFFDDIVPHPEGVDPEADLLHERSYVVRTYLKDDHTLVMRGAIRDQKPPGLYVQDDPEPLTVHHMILDLHVSMPDLVITHAQLTMNTHPHSICPEIVPHYGSLVGLSIARGFTHKVRELFGGPRGCTHTTALLQAMAPVAVQSTWSFRAKLAQRQRETGSAMPVDPELRRRAMMANLNTCHVWDEAGEHVEGLRNGAPAEMPLWIAKRYAELGRDVSGFSFD